MKQNILMEKESPLQNGIKKMELISNSLKVSRIGLGCMEMSEFYGLNL
jgi:hypothetical protein